MSFVTQGKTKRLLAVHGWAGTLLGLMLYVVIFTGAVVVFEKEIDTWARGSLVPEAGIGTQVDHHFRVAAREVDRTFYENVSIARDPSGALRYLFRGHEEGPEGEADVVVRLLVDAETGDVLERWEGPAGELPQDTASALRDFWIDLHVQLYLPNPYGLILVGVLGLMMMFAAVSGILIHGHLLRDLFVSARGRARLLGARDLHILAGSWGLPFAVILAFTGAFFGFATSVGLPAMSMLAFGGDRAAIEDTLFVDEGVVDLAPAPTAALDFVVHDAMTRSRAQVSSIAISNYDSAGAKLLVSMTQSPGSLVTQVLAFDGVTRRFEGVRPLIGQEPSWGSTLLDLIIPLHFGNFAGLASKTVWFGMGLAMAFVTATGMLLWTKRRETQPLWRGFRRWITVTVWGVPCAMLISAVAYFLTLPAGDPYFWTPRAFFAACVVILGSGVMRQEVEVVLRRATALLCVLLPLLRLLTGGASWSEALLAGVPIIIVLDVLLIATGAVLLRREKPRSVHGSLREPAE
ncbi:MAG: PepSY-associated TM helix domain-containing protein [Pseudomonadota bacterium]